MLTANTLLVHIDLSLCPCDHRQPDNLPNEMLAEHELGRLLNRQIGRLLAPIRNHKMARLHRRGQLDCRHFRQNVDSLPEAD